MTSSHAGTGRSPASARAMMNGVISRDLARTSMMSFWVTRYDGMSTFWPLTVMWPCLTSWRAMSLLLAKPARKTTFVEAALQDLEQVVTGLCRGRGSPLRSSCGNCFSSTP